MTSDLHHHKNMLYQHKKDEAGERIRLIKLRKIHQLENTNEGENFSSAKACPASPRLSYIVE